MSISLGELSPYQLDTATVRALSSLLVAQQEASLGKPVPHQANGSQATGVAQEALINWNSYLSTNEERHREAFLAQAAWLRDQATTFAEDLAGWPVVTRIKTLAEPVPLLSASTQGLGLSVLVRAYQMTGDDTFLRQAQRAARAFERDIFDGGVCAPIGETGVFFEEVAAYPASHSFSACLIALTSLYDYLALVDDAEVARHMQRCLATLADLAPIFDVGYWSRADLASRRLASPALHALHIALLNALARTSGDEAWAALASRWAGYQRSRTARTRYLLSSSVSRWRQRFWTGARRLFFRSADDRSQESKQKVCVPITAFPVAGGMRTVLAGVAKAMEGEWEMEYLTRYVGPNPDGLTIWSFPKTWTSNWGFPKVWLYVLLGWWRLLVLLRQRRYQVVISQDGLYSGTYAALAARMAGARVVCMDHGTIQHPYSESYRAELLAPVASAPWPLRLPLRFRVTCYLLSLRLLALLSTRYSDFFLPASRDVEETYRQQWGLTPDRAQVFPFLMDTRRYAPCDAEVRAERRARLRLPADAIVIAMVNRLAAEKSITTALQGVSKVLQRLPAETASRVRLVIAGEGSLREQIEQEIRQLRLESACLLLGEATPDEVVSLLSISDLFLYTAIRGINSAAAQEAMAAGLPVIASLEPRVAETLLSGGRGLAFPPADVEALTLALEEVLRDPLRARQMGALARAYIETHHSARILRRCLLRATAWPLAASDVNREVSKGDLIVAERKGSSEGNA
jgi:glycosyltransferase involved in cell wall biosynthesis